MKRRNRPNVVIFVFIDGKKILVEKRFLEIFGKEHYLMPGGTVKKQENLEDALRREVFEELRIKPISFKAIPTDEDVLGMGGSLLIPFLINKWEGKLPEKILDKGNPLVWLEIDKVLETPFEPTRKIAKLIKNHLLNLK